MNLNPLLHKNLSYCKIHRPRSNVTRKLILENNFQETEHVTVSTNTLISIQKQSQMITSNLIFMKAIVSELKTGHNECQKCQVELDLMRGMLLIDI